MCARRFLLGLAMIMVIASCGSDSDTIAEVAEIAEPTTVIEPAPPTSDVPEAAESTEEAESVVSTAVPETSAIEVVFGDQFPEVLAVSAQLSDGEQWRFNVTLSSPYDTPERYADAWRVLDELDNELGIRVLGHDHASEQPFTRSHTVQVPAATTTVWIEGRDQANGWSGQRFEVVLP